MTMELSVDAWTVLSYGLFSFVVVFPPTEMLSAGLTVEKLFSFFLGDEQLSFVAYHIRRTCLNLFAHSLLPLGFFAVLELQREGLNVFGLLGEVEEAQLWWRYGLLASLALPLAAASLVMYWRLDG